MIDIEQPDDMNSGGNFVSKPGFYHLVVFETEEHPASQDGRPLNGFQVTFSVLAGTHADQVDKSIDIMFWSPDPTEPTKTMPKKRQAAFCLATGLIDEFQPGVRKQVNLSDAKGRQCCAKLAFKQKKNEATGKWEDTDRLDISFADIWHVDAEEVAKNNVPLQMLAIGNIDAALRKVKAGTSGSQPGTVAAGTTSTRKAVDLADV